MKNTNLRFTKKNTGLRGSGITMADEIQSANKQAIIGRQKTQNVYWRTK
jgi:hypothetical protein